MVPQGNRPQNAEGHELTVIIPCFNEERTVVELVRRVRAALPAAEVIVVDDASTDDSVARLRQVKDQLEVKLLQLATNGGKGSAVRAGLGAATRRWVVIQDADLEYDPGDLLKILVRASRGGLQAVYGSRYASSGPVSGGAWLNYLGVKLLAVLEWILYGRWLSDPHTCYKMVRRDVLQRLRLQSDGFELCAELNSKLLREGMEIPEVPIGYRPRGVDEGKKIGVRDFFVAVWTYLKYRFTHPREPWDREPKGDEQRSSWPYVGSRIAIGLLLLIAGIAKLSPPGAVPIAAWLVLPKTLVFAWGALEFLVGWACLVLVPHRLLHQVVVSMFVLFLGVLGVQWWSGGERCQCMGSLSLPLTAMAVVDGLVLASLIYYRDLWQRMVYLPSGILAEQISNVRVVVPVLLLAGIGWFGSLDAAHGFLLGQTVLVDSANKFAGEVKQSEFVDVSYVLKNLTAEPIRVLGANASCSCIAILDLPATVEPGGKRAIRLRVRGRTPDRVQRESAELVFDDSALRLVLSAMAVVRPNH